MTGIKRLGSTTHSLSSARQSSWTRTKEPLPTSCLTTPTSAAMTSDLESRGEGVPRARMLSNGSPVCCARDVRGCLIPVLEMLFHARLALSKVLPLGVPMGLFWYRAPVARRCESDNQLDRSATPSVVLEPGQVPKAEETPGDSYHASSPPASCPSPTRVKTFFRASRQLSVRSVLESVNISGVVPGSRPPFTGCRSFFEGQQHMRYLTK
jgi:hypothetical protein